MTDLQPSIAQEQQESDQRNGHSMNVGQVERLASVVGGGALVAYGLRQRSLAGVGLALLGGALAYRGTSGHCMVYQALGINTATGAGSSTIHVEQSVTINKPVAEVYGFWRNFENLPQFMKHLKEVRTLDAKRSHWVASAPLNMSVEWDAEVLLEKENELIAWRSLPDAQVPNGGTVRFSPATDGKSTVVKVVLEYAPPAGALGAAVAKLFGEEPSQQIQGDLRRLRNLLEAGEIPSVHGQPSGRGRQQTHQADQEGAWRGRALREAQGAEHMAVTAPDALQQKEVGR